jgi:uncharacterized protein YlaI
MLGRALGGLSCRLLIKGLRSRKAACTRCGHDDFRESRRLAAPVIRALGLRVYRCSYCLERFALRTPVRKRANA